MIILRQREFGNKENKLARKAWETAKGESMAKTANAYGNAVGTVPSNVAGRREGVFRAVYRGQQAAGSGDAGQFIDRAMKGKYVGAEGSGTGMYGKGIDTTTTRATTTNQVINAKAAIRKNGLIGTKQGGLFGDQTDIHISRNTQQNKQPGILSGLSRVRPGFAVGSY